MKNISSLTTFFIQFVLCHRFNNTSQNIWGTDAWAVPTSHFWGDYPQSLLRSVHAVLNVVLDRYNVTEYTKSLPCQLWYNICSCTVTCILFLYDPDFSYVSMS